MCPDEVREGKSRSGGQGGSETGVEGERGEEVRNVSVEWGVEVGVG